MITPHEHSVSGALEEMTNQLLGVVDPRDKRSELLVELVACLSTAETLHFELQKLEGPDRQRLASSSLEAVRESHFRALGAFMETLPDCPWPFYRLCVILAIKDVIDAHSDDAEPIEKRAGHDAQ